MSTLSLREIEDMLRHAEPQARHRTLRAVADLFLSSAPSLDEAQIEVFDTVFGSLVDEGVRSELPQLSQRIAPVGNAPPRLVKRLAFDDDISVAGPVLAQSPRLSTEDLCEIARTKGNAHMLAVSTRADLTEPVTDILIDKGDQLVARSIAGNRSARLSSQGVDKLIGRAERDETIAAALSFRPEIKPELLNTALSQATARAEQSSRLIASAMRLAIALQQTGDLHDLQLTMFANSGEYETLVAAIALRSNLKYETIDNLMHPQRVAGIVLVCKSAGISWATADAVLRLARKRNNVTDDEIERTHREFVDVSRSTAERIVRFWQIRQSVTS